MFDQLFWPQRWQRASVCCKCVAHGFLSQVRKDWFYFKRVKIKAIRNLLTEDSLHSRLSVVEGRNALMGSHYGAACMKHQDGKPGSVVRDILGILSCEVVTGLKENVILLRQQFIGILFTKTVDKVACHLNRTTKNSASKLCYSWWIKLIHFFL